MGIGDLFKGLRGDDRGRRDEDPEYRYRNEDQEHRGEHYAPRHSYRDDDQRYQEPRHRYRNDDEDREYSDRDDDD